MGHKGSAAGDGDAIHEIGIEIIKANDRFQGDEPASAPQKIQKKFTIFSPQEEAGFKSTRQNNQICRFAAILH